MGTLSRSCYGVHYLAGENLDPTDGSIMIVVATDAPLDARNLERLAKRAFMAIARTGGFASNGSGDYVIAFSTAPEVRIDTRAGTATNQIALLKNSEMTPLFLAAVEATEEAILNSLFQAQTMTGPNGRTIEALPLDKMLEILGAALQFASGGGLEARPKENRCQNVTENEYNDSNRPQLFEPKIKPRQPLPNGKEPGSRDQTDHGQAHQNPCPRKPPGLCLLLGRHLSRKKKLEGYSLKWERLLPPADGATPNCRNERCVSSSYITGKISHKKRRRKL